MLLNAEELVALRSALAADQDRARLLETLRARAAPVLERMPPLPRVKALLSRDGGICPDDGWPLVFDPASPDRHLCPACRRTHTGERHHRHWARAQHLWLAERTADLALIATMTDAEPAASRAAELIAAYETLYFELPNRDNLLGPSHLFFSTYLESMWITSFLAAAYLLREAGMLPRERVDGVNEIADEAAHLIAEFGEGLSNRQTWHAAALTAIASWFGDEELAATAVESRAGLLGHLTDGFGTDGLWWEGENYHLFAIRGLTIGMHWARGMGFALLEHEELRAHYRAALLAPSLTALPDLTFPARRDSRFGVSLAQPAFLEALEVGRAWLADGELDAWLEALYAVPAPPAEHYDAWLHDAGRAAPERRDRTDLSWWAFTALAPRPEPGSVPRWQPCSAFLPEQGLGVLRTGDRYASLECGADIGGHGHPDRLHLTLHADGVHWLPDQGTGSYVVPSLMWYRSALAHNAPRIAGENAGGEDAWCEAFDCDEAWGWCRGRAGGLRRSIVLGPHHLVDVLELDAGEEREVDLPWHLEGDLRLDPAASWAPCELDHPFVANAERLIQSDGSLRVEVSHRESGKVLRAHFLALGAEVVRAESPALPTRPDARRRFLLFRARAPGGGLRWVTVLDSAPVGSADVVTSVDLTGSGLDLESAAGRYRFRFDESGVTIDHAGRAWMLKGARPKPRRPRPILEAKPAPEIEGSAPRVMDPPALDGTLDGMDTSAPLLLDEEHQYRRSEEPFDPGRFSARAWVNRDDRALYVAVEVSKPDLVFRPEGAPPLELDNEPDDINSDGLQIYVRLEEEVRGFLVVPAEGGALRVRPLSDDRAPPVTGAWSATESGYQVTLELTDAAIGLLAPGSRIGFDLLVNEMLPERERRAGQLVWSGGDGWIYLRGDRHDPARLGVLELG